MPASLLLDLPKNAAWIYLNLGANLDVTEDRKVLSLICFIVPLFRSAPPPAGCRPLPLQERRHPPAAGTLQEPPPARCRNPGKDSRTDAAADCVAVSCGVCTQVDYL